IKSHDIGCHGFEHLRIAHIGPARFRQDLRQAKEVLEQAAGQPVVSFRAPYFSADGCNPWYGEILAEAGMRIESSQRCWRVPRGFRGSYPLEGSGGRVTAVPLPALGLGHKRLTLIGGTYFRLLPLGAVRQLLRLAQNRGFIPTLYLHPYDIDPHAPLLHYPAGRYIKHRLSAWMRRLGRRSAAVKVHALSRDFMLNSLEGVFGAARSEHL
ncbi:MAG TPA: DUF3473 domain-containing protein, partial [Oligoflexia bacterium]|nr:DUF3473 domain-containing protein [Oligoflexia bacterium]